MESWVKKRIKPHALVGAVKDRLSTGRVIARQGPLTQIDLVVLRATTHEEQVMQEEAVQAVLEIGGTSRMRVSHCIRVLMDRLNRTSSWVVALKCLILIHRCLYEGGFMFQDQLSVRPANGGHNYLNLSQFKDDSSPFTWAVSAWIRWYARFIEQWIQTARRTRSFMDTGMDYSSAQIEQCLSVSNRKLTRDINALHDLLQEASSCEADESVRMHVLVKEGIRLVVVITFAAYEEIKLRLYEAQTRVSILEVSEALVLLGICEKLMTESMAFRDLLESVTGQLLQHDYSAFEQVLLSDCNLANLKQSFQLASTSTRISASPEQLALPWSSGGSCSSGGSDSIPAEETRCESWTSFHSWQKLSM